METTEQVKNRIDSIAGTKQITQSMRLVSTARLRRVRDRMDANLPFLLETSRMVLEAASERDVNKHRYVCGVQPRGAQRGGAGGGGAQRGGAGAGACVIAIAADRGLCGGYNINVCREARSLIKDAGATKVIAVGQKARDFFVRRRKGEGGVDKAFVGMSERPFFEDAEEIASYALGWYDRGEVGSVYIVYTRFVNILTLPVASAMLLPIGAAATPAAGAAGVEGVADAAAATVPAYGHGGGGDGSIVSGSGGSGSGGNGSGDGSGDAADGGATPFPEGGAPEGRGLDGDADDGGPRLKTLVRYEPKGERLLDLAVPFYVSAALFGAMLEASVCEQSARIASMDSAVRNSEQMLEELTVQYNKARQGGITEELADIIGGASALKRKTARQSDVLRRKMANRLPREITSGG